jgi:energy-converting hydrogenase B subunit K
MKINDEKCINCQKCVALCPAQAIKLNKEGRPKIDKKKCEMCGYCKSDCPVRAVED